jgi:serine/threonine-protein kinase
MAQPDRSRIKEVFGEALRAPAGERAALLAVACGEDSRLRAEVESLLAAHERSAAFLDGPTIPGSSESSGEGQGTRIGPYKLLEAIGEGGFGTVYMAEQEEPIRRRVALKVLKLGMDSRQVIARFEAERQALALMDHPNIARVLDAGTTAAGRPYFVMELVRGVPITQYCDHVGLSTGERLAVFLPVCHAVQHAHQKGIIHRDLKPSNVLVTMHDGKPVAKVIDFGIAKALEQRLTQKTLFTGFGQMIGTPAYMSPEQAEMSGLDVDTRSDVYSLGVLLYELLAGVPPFDPIRLQQAGIAEILRIIKEEEPPRPSTRASTLGDVLATVASRHGTEPKRLGAVLRGDLDWIVMKALAKERQRRYDSASGLAQDVERYLAHEPVSAGPPSLAYRARKFVRRNRAGVAAAVLIFAALIAGIVGTTAGLLQARAAQGEARASAADAERKLTIAREGADLLLNDVVRVLPKIPGARELQRNMLGLALRHYERLAAEKPGDVEERRRIWIAFQELGDAYLALGDPAHAEEAFARFAGMVDAAAVAAPENDLYRVDRSVSLDRKGMLAFAVGRADEAAALQEQSRALLQDVLVRDPQSPVVRKLLAYCYGNLARVEWLRGDARACKDLEDKELAIWETLRKESPRDPEVVWNLAMTLQRRAESTFDPRRALERAVELLDEAAAIEGSTARIAHARAHVLNQQARAASLLGEPEAAREHAAAARSAIDALLAAEPTNPSYVLLASDVRSSLADAALESGDVEGCGKWINEAHDLVARLADVQRESVDFRFFLARSSARLAELAERAGDYEHARQALRRANDLYEELLALLPRNRGDLDGAILTHFLLAGYAGTAGELEQAREHVDRADDLSRRALEENPEEPRFRYLRAHVLHDRSSLAYQTGDLAASEALARESQALLEPLADEFPTVVQYGSMLGVVIERLGDIAFARVDLATAASMRRRNLEVCERMLRLQPNDPGSCANRVASLGKLADLLIAAGQDDEAERTARSMLAEAQGLSERDPSNLRLRTGVAHGLRRIGQIQMSRGETPEAIKTFREMADLMDGVVARAPEVQYFRGALADALQMLAEACWKAGEVAETRSSWRRNLEQRRALAQDVAATPDACNGYAWALLVAQPPDLRDPEAAVVYARRAVELSRGADPGAMDTLALALFESGDAEQAVATQRRALELVGTQDSARRTRFQERLERYQAGSK